MRLRSAGGREESNKRKEGPGIGEREGEERMKAVSTLKWIRKTQR